MRISDSSSDVCSSALEGDVRRVTLFPCAVARRFSTPCVPPGPLGGARGFFFAALACRRSRMRPLIPIVIPAVSFLLVAIVVLDPQGAAFAAGQEAAANATTAGAGPVAQAQSAPTI